jgi:hypothetical protein
MFQPLNMGSFKEDNSFNKIPQRAQHKAIGNESIYDLCNVF